MRYRVTPSTRPAPRRVRICAAKDRRVSPTPWSRRWAGSTSSCRRSSANVWPTSSAPARWRSEGGRRSWREAGGPESRRTTMTERAAPEKSREPEAQDDRPTHSPDGVDLTLIRWMLSLTPEERRDVLQVYARSILRLRGDRRKPLFPGNPQCFCGPRRRLYNRGGRHRSHP